jgi:hypothetical protein
LLPERAAISEAAGMEFAKITEQSSADSKTTLVKDETGFRAFIKTLLFNTSNFTFS